MVGGIRGGASGGRGSDQGGAPALAEALRAALARWASGVTVVAVRDDRLIHAITATAFCPVSLEPPLILVSVGPNATILSLIEPGSAFAVTALAQDQGRLASMFVDPAPIGRDAFAADGPPIIPAGLFGLACTVDTLHTAGDHVLVVGRVDDVVHGTGDAPLIRYERAWRRLT